MRTCSGLLIILLLLASTATAQSWSVSIDGIEPILPVLTDTIQAGSILKIHIRMTNNSDGYYSVSNGFTLFSPWGATWTDSAHGNYHGANLGPIGIDTTGLLSAAQFPTAFTIQTFSGSPLMADGFSPDTVLFSGTAIEAPYGLPPHFDGRVFTILLRTKIADTNKTICIDSVLKGSSHEDWKWSRLNAGGDAVVYPTWSGMRCIRLWMCPCLPPHITNCLATLITQHCYASYDFDAADPQGYPLSYELVSGPGSINPTTGLWNATNVPPGQYVVSVSARNSFLESMPCTFNWTAIDTQFASCEHLQPQPLVLSLGDSVSHWPLVINDCTPLVYTLVDSGGIKGTIRLDDATGWLTFIPIAADLALPSPIITRVQIQDTTSQGTCFWNQSWTIQRACTGTVGNANCDSEEAVDVADLTMLIDNLFISFLPLCSQGEANCDGQGSVDVGDLTALIDNLFITFTPLPACQ